MCMYSLIILANDRCPLARGFWTGSATDSEIGDFPLPLLRVNHNSLVLIDMHNHHYRRGIVHSVAFLRTRDMGFSAERIRVLRRFLSSKVFPLGSMVAIAMTRDMGFSAEMALVSFALLAASLTVPLLVLCCDIFNSQGSCLI